MAIGTIKYFQTGDSNRSISVSYCCANSKCFDIPSGEPLAVGKQGGKIVGNAASQGHSRLKLINGEQDRHGISPLGQ